MSEVQGDHILQEEEVKTLLNHWLMENGWSTNVAWGKTRGVDIEAKKDGKCWLIEVKGCGSLNPMRVNYFLAILGETLQRMNDDDAKYSIALPRMKQYLGLWERLPALAKQRTSISALFVSSSGDVVEVF